MLTLFWFLFQTWKSTKCVHRSCWNQRQAKIFTNCWGIETWRKPTTHGKGNKQSLHGWKSQFWKKNHELCRHYWTQNCFELGSGVKPHPIFLPNFFLLLLLLLSSLLRNPLNQKFLTPHIFTIHHTFVHLLLVHVALNASKQILSHLSPPISGWFASLPILSIYCGTYLQGILLLPLLPSLPPIYNNVKPSLGEIPPPVLFHPTFYWSTCFSEKKMSTPTL